MRASYLAALPEELFAQLLLWLAPKDVLNAAGAAKGLRRVARGEAVWRPLYARFFPTLESGLQCDADLGTTLEKYRQRYVVPARGDRRGRSARGSPTPAGASYFLSRFSNPSLMSFPTFFLPR